METRANTAIIARNVRRLRKDARLTQMQLAERVGCCAAYISRIECGEKSPSLDLLLRLSEVFHVSCDSILKDQTGEFHSEKISYMLEGCSEGLTEQIEQMIRIMKNVSRME